jgi:hypothetical protein
MLKIMKPQEKANELVNKYLISTPIVFYIDDAKKCALIAVDEIINSAPFFSYDDEGNFYRSVVDAKRYWEQVKQEIEKL